MIRALLAAVIVALGVTFGNPWFSGNFGVVEAQRVYRSAQPEGDLRQLITQYHLASVLNLRGGSHDDTWYTEEVRATRELGVDFYDLPMSATRRPLRRELLILIDLFDRCRYPLLIHCKSGSDRTGLATALYRMTKKGEPPELAERAFSLGYGHIPLLGPEHLHEPLQEYGAWLRQSGKRHTSARLRFWVEQFYASAEPRRNIPLLEPGPRRQAPPQPAKAEGKGLTSLAKESL
jgi:hypothetical protein